MTSDLACSHHPTARAAWVCTECGSALCSACVKVVRLDPGRSVMLCSDCQGLCERPRRPDPEGVAGSWFGKLAGALVFPLRGSGGLLLLAIGIVSGLFAQFHFIWPLGIGAMILSIGVGAYLLAFLRRTLLSAIDEDETPPAWQASDMEELKEGFLQFLGVYLISFGPWLVASFWVRWEGGSGVNWPGWLLAWGIFYGPMALLAAVIHDDLAAANPVLVLVSIGKTLPRYLGVLLLLGCIGGACYLAQAALVSAGWRGPAAALESGGWLYLAMVAMRVLGLFYRLEKERLGWG